MKKTDTRSDEQRLRDAIAKQQADRRRLGIDVTTARGGTLPDAPGAATQPRGDGRGLDAGDTLAAFKSALPAEAEGAYRCVARWDGDTMTRDRGDRCTVKISFPGICSGCAERAAHAERAAQIARRIATEIPAEYRDVRWDNALALRCEDGKTPRLPMSEERFAGLRRALEALPVHGRIVVVGAAGNGKSTLAAAWARHHLEAGVERVCFAQVRKLLSYRPVTHEQVEAPITLQAFATAAERLVIDDLGDELHNAPAEGGVAAQRMEASRTLIADRFEARLGWVLTTGLSEEKIKAIYNDGTGRRIFENADVIPLGKLLPPPRAKR